MFDLFGGPPADWEPIPDSVLAELPCLDDTDPAPEGMSLAISCPDDLVWQALERDLGVETLPLIAAAPLGDLSPAGLSLALRRLDELTAHVEAAKARVTAMIAGPAPVTDAARREDYSPHEVSVATRCSVYTADARIRLARDLTRRLHGTAAALESGRMTYPQAVALSEATAQLSDEITGEIETGMLRFCHRQSLGHFRNALRGWVARKDPDYTKKAKAERREPVVEHRATDDGCGELFIRGPLEITTQISMLLTAYAAKTRATLGGSAAQRKLAGLRDLCEAYLGTPAAPRQHGRLPILNICIDLATLLGLRDGNAEIPGIGAIPADAARWLLADGAPMRRMIIDPDSGALLELGHTTYTATPALAEYLCAKNLVSASPHSNVPSRHCDMEHNTPYDPGGTTDPTNVTPIDRRWHRVKTHAGWRYEKDPDGIITWTSPTGLTCTIEPQDYRA